MRQIALCACSAIVAFGLACPTGVFAQDWKPDRNVEIVVGTPPGSGYDSVARKLQEIWQTANLVDKSVTVVNKPGGFNAVGNAYLNAHPGNGNYVAITGTLLLSDNLSGNTAISYKDFSPLAVLLNEEIVFAVNPSSSIKTGKDFIDRLKQDPTSVSVAISGIGGQNHIALGLVAQAGGADASRLKVVGFQGGAEAVTAALGRPCGCDGGPGLDRGAAARGRQAAGHRGAVGEAARRRLCPGSDLARAGRGRGVLAMARPDGPQGPDGGADRLLGRRARQDGGDQGLEGPHRAHPADLPLSRQRPGARRSSPPRTRPCAEF